MLYDFISAHRAEIIAMTHARVMSRDCPKPTEAEVVHGIPAFLNQLGDALRRAEARGSIDHTEITTSAEKHGADLFRMGLTIAQVVHDYGDVCQSVTELAIHKGAAIDGLEFQTLNLCLDDAIAGAVTAYARQRETKLATQGTERLGVFAHELRNLLNTAMLAFESIRNGRVPASGSTGIVHLRSLLGLRDLIDRSLADVRLDTGIEHRERISVAELLEEVEAAASVQAQARSQRFSVASVDRTMTIEGDRQIIAAALSNLLHNAFKFTQRNGTISLTTRSTESRVLFDVEDECGGLPKGTVEALFQPFQQSGSDRQGLGLGLSICAKAAAAHNGQIHAQDLPGRGCIFTLDLPRTPPPRLAVVESA